MTFAELIQESELREYSNEYFNVVKECAELEVMGLFIDQQKFLRENARLVESTTGTFGNDFFTESVSNNDLEALEESFKDRVKGVVDSIKNAFAKAWRAFLQFFNEHVRHISEQDTKAAAVAKRINDLKLYEDNEKNSKYIEIINKSVNYAGEQSKIKQFAANANCGLDNRTIDVFGDQAAAITNALTTDAMIIGPSIRVLPVNVLMEIVNRLTKVQTDSDIDNLKTYIQQNIASEGKNGYKVSVNKKDMNKFTKNLESLKGDVDKWFNAASEVDARDKSVAMAENIKGVNELCTTLSKMITTEITALNRIQVYRATALNSLAKSLGIKEMSNDKKPGPRESADPDPAQ